jgi:hypothetical protein
MPMRACGCLVAGHELGGEVPGVVACRVGQVGVQVGNGTLRKGTAAEVAETKQVSGSLSTDKGG